MGRNPDLIFTVQLAQVLYGKGLLVQRVETYSSGKVMFLVGLRT
jgi:hypothetical protein